MNAGAGHRVLWLTRYGWEGPSSRYRILQYADGLAELNWQSDFEELAPWRARNVAAAQGSLRRLRRLRQLPRALADIIVVQKEPVLPEQLWPAARRGLLSASRPVVWDLDDAVWAISDGRRRMASDVARRSNLVVAGNHLIAQWATEHGASDVIVIPTCFGPGDGRPPSTPVPHAGVQICWIGSPSTAQLLHEYEPLLLALASLPQTTLTFVGASPPASVALHQSVSTLDWTPRSERTVLEQSDFGLALQARSEFADHKCGFKIIQYMAYGVVPIATDNPVHRSILDGLGLLVTARNGKSAAEYARTCPEPETRKVLIDRWHSTYSVEVGMSSWHAALSSLAQ